MSGNKSRKLNQVGMRGGENETTSHASKAKRERGRRPSGSLSGPGLIYYNRSFRVSINLFWQCINFNKL